VHLLARMVGVGVETADMLVHEILSRNLRDQRALARYAGLTARPIANSRAMLSRPKLPRPIAYGEAREVWRTPA
jgi:transposase